MPLPLAPGQGGSISPKGYLTSPTGAAKMPFWDAPSEAAEAVRSRTGSVDQQTPGFAEAVAGAWRQHVLLPCAEQTLHHGTHSDGCWGCLNAPFPCIIIKQYRGTILIWTCLSGLRYR